ILGKSVLRRADGSDDPGAQIRFPIHPVMELPLAGIEEETIDREITPPGVRNGITEDYAFRMPAILVISFGPEGGDLKFMASFQNNDNAEFPPNRNRSRNQLIDLVRQGGGDDVIIVRNPTDKR